MKPLLLAFVDAPQHLRIVATLVRAAEQAVEPVLLTTLPAPAGEETGFSRIERIELPLLAGWPRAVRLLLRGLGSVRALRRPLSALTGEGSQPVRVLLFNDTGVPQRRLIEEGRRRGWLTVLVQDGLTETQHRESGAAFAARLAFTRRVLSPLGLGHLGTSRYGTAGADVVFADGPAAQAFFRERNPQARVEAIGLLRPAPRAGAVCDEAGLLFWCVDFAGGLNRHDLHERQLQALEQLDAALASSGRPLRATARLHPGDVPLYGEYRQRLGGLGRLRLVDPREQREPLAPPLPLLSASLQSAGVFDALAAGVPSYFVGAGVAGLAPAWTPAALALADVDALVACALRFATDRQARSRAWEEQVQALAPTIRIPCDPQAVRAALG